MSPPRRPDAAPARPRSPGEEGGSGPAVEVEGLGVVLDEQVLLLEADAQVHAGRVLAVTGPNGSGKTTLLRAVAGLVPPTAGTVRVLGRAPQERERRFRRDLAAAIGPPQTARDLTVLEHLQFIGATWGEAAGRAETRGRDLLEELGLTALAHRFPHELSSGQSQLVALALVLARPARVLLLDEPEQRLDPSRQDLVQAALRRRAQGGTAIIAATHSPLLVEELADEELRLEGVA